MSLDFEEDVKKNLRMALDEIGAQDIPMIISGPNPHGDLSFSCFQAARKLNRTPESVADELANIIRRNQADEAIRNREMCSICKIFFAPGITIWKHENGWAHPECVIGVEIDHND